jgi:predicted TPR repeat methyltransferase
MSTPINPSPEADPHEAGLYRRAYGLKEHEVKGFYSEWAATYDTELINGKGYAMPGRCRDAFVRHIDNRDSTILDIGCGTGLLATRLAAVGFVTIDGIDYSPEMLDQERQTGVYRSLFQADVNERLDFDDGEYDVVTAMGIFSFGHVYATALDALCRILRPSGHLIIGINDPFYEEGSVVAKLAELEQVGTLQIVQREHGPHMTASDVHGWVIVATKRAT